jgi:chorismate synthase
MNSFGNSFRVSIFGESHGPMIGVVMDGVPFGLSLTPEDFKNDIDRRRPTGEAGTKRKESDEPRIVTGVLDGVTTGAPLTILFENENTRSSDYSQFRDIPRPGHADFAAAIKYSGYNDLRGGGHFSGRLTLCLVAAGVVAKKILKENGIKIKAKVLSIGGKRYDPNQPIQFPSNGDSLGGVVECRCYDVPAGAGEPFFDSIESVIAHLAFSIPGVRGIEFGDGFKAANMTGSQHNDCFVNAEGETSTNSSGGINGGLANGNPIVFRVAIKPTSSITTPQKTFNFETNQMDTLVIKGRHDKCIALRCPVIVESIAALALLQF